MHVCVLPGLAEEDALEEDALDEDTFEEEAYSVEKQLTDMGRTSLPQSESEAAAIDQGQCEEDTPMMTRLEMAAAAERSNRRWQAANKTSPVQEQTEPKWGDAQ